MTHSFPTRRSSDLLNFRGTVNYSHARYGSFLAPCYSGESIAAGCNTTFRGGTGQRLDGKPTTNSPPWTGSLGGSYDRSEEHTSELHSLMRISYAVFCLKKKTPTTTKNEEQT